MRKILKAGAILVIMVVGVVLIVGWSLPVNHVASVTATYDKSPSELFEILSDFPRMPEWRSGVTEVRRLDDRNGNPVWLEVSGTGNMPYEVTVLTPPHHMVTVIADDGLPFGGTWTYRIAETPDGGASLTITENGEVYNLIFRFVSRFVIGHHTTATTYLRDLGRRVGTDVSPRRIPAS